MTKPISFDAFLKKGAKLQQAYITEERSRFAIAQKLWYKYAADMRALGLHALTGTEITDRLRELDGMERDIPEKYKDSAIMRTMYDFHLMQV